MQRIKRPAGLMVLATPGSAGMPRACPVDGYVSRYHDAACTGNATGLPHRYLHKFDSTYKCTEKTHVSLDNLSGDDAFSSLFMDASKDV